MLQQYGQLVIYDDVIETVVGFVHSNLYLCWILLHLVNEVSLLNWIVKILYVVWLRLRKDCYLIVVNDWKLFEYWIESLWIVQNGWSIAELNKYVKTRCSNTKCHCWEIMLWLEFYWNTLPTLYYRSALTWKCDYNQSGVLLIKMIMCQRVLFLWRLWTYCKIQKCMILCVRYANCCSQHLCVIALSFVTIVKFKDPIMMHDKFVCLNRGKIRVDDNDEIRYRQI